MLPRCGEYAANKARMHYAGYTIILNHSQEWDGKPTGSHGDSRVAEISKQIFGPGFFYTITMRNCG